MLIECTECGCKVSSFALFCPHCGYPINESEYSIPVLKTGDAVLHKTLGYASVQDVRQSSFTALFYETREIKKFALASFTTFFKRVSASDEKYLTAKTISSNKRERIEEFNNDFDSEEQAKFEYQEYLRHEKADE